MGRNATTYPWRTSLAWSAVFRAVGLSIIGFIIWLWVSVVDDPAWRAVTLVAILALAALVGVGWYLPRARAERRWRAALERFLEQEQAKEIPDEKLVPEIDGIPDREGPDPYPPAHGLARSSAERK